MKNRIIILIFALVAILSGNAVAKETLSLAVVTIQGAAQSVCAEKFKEILESRSNYEVEINYGSSLGTETDII